MCTSVGFVISFSICVRKFDWILGGGGGEVGGIKTVFGEHTYCTTEENYVSISLITCIFAFSFAYMETLF